MFDKNYYDLPDRQSMRLQSYDYRQPGYYYITICVADKQCLLSSIVDTQIHLSLAGTIVQLEFNKLPERFKHVRLDEYIIMPNHFHGIIVFEGPPPAPKEVYKAHIPARFRQYIDNAEHVQQAPRDNADSTADNSELPLLGEVVRSFKAACTRIIRQTTVPDFAWQSRLYEHVIRDIPDLNRIRNYIVNNPASWQEDILHRSQP